jgi:hypothetical protein
LEKADLSSSQIIQQIDEDPNNQITTMDLSTNDVPTDRKKGGAK